MSIPATNRQDGVGDSKVQGSMNVEFGMRNAECGMRKKREIDIE